MSYSAASELKALHVASLGAAESNNTLLGKHVEREGVDALLVDDHKRLVLAVADLIFSIQKFRIL